MLGYENLVVILFCSIFAVGIGVINFIILISLFLLEGERRKREHLLAQKNGV